MSLGSGRYLIFQVWEERADGSTEFDAKPIP